MKRSFYILLTLVLFFILLPQASFADDAAGTVNITVSLPDGVTAGDRSYVSVSLVKPVEIDSNGVVQSDTEWLYSRNVWFSSGSKTVTFNNVAAGKYIIYAAPYCNSTEVLGKSGYYSIDGIEGSSAYTATPFTLEPGGVVSGTIALERAETSISGEIQTSTPVTEDTYITFELYPDSERNGSSSYSVDVLIPSGEFSAPYAIGLKEDSYTVQAWKQNGGIGFSYSFNEAFTTDWDKDLHLDLLESPIVDYVFNVDPLVAGSTGKAEVSVTVVLPEALAQGRRYRVCYGTQEDFWYDSRTYYAQAGEDSFTVTLSVEKEKPFIFAYIDVTDANSIGGRAIGFQYASQDGVTSIRSNAKEFTFTGPDSITIGEQSYYSISGMLNRNGFADNTKAAGYVITEFADGEVFTDRVVFNADELEKSFTIYVPQRYNNQAYTLYVAPAEQWLSARIQTAQKKAVTESVLTGNASVGTVNLDLSNAFTYSGTISLPANVVAPTGGLAVEIGAWTSGSDNWAELGTIVIPGGSNSVAFSLAGDAGYTNFEANLIGSHPGIFEIAEYRVDDLGNISFIFAKDALIRGTIYLPEGINGVYAGYVNAWVDSGWSSEITIPAGKDHVNYCLHVPFGQTLNGMRLEAQYASNDKILTNSLYIGSNWSQADNREEIYVDGDYSGIDFHIPVAKTIGGQIIDLNGDVIEYTLQNGRRPWIYLYEENSNDWSVEAEVNLAPDGNWTAKLPESLQGDYVIQFSFNGVTSNVLYQNYYYASGSAATSLSDAETIYLGVDDLTDIDFYVETGYIITGRVLIPEDGYVNRITSEGGNWNTNVYFEDASSNSTYYASVTIDPSSKIWEYKTVLPKQTATYTYYVNGYSNLLDRYDSNVYLSGKSETASVTVSGNTAVPDITLPLLKYQINGHIVSTDGSPLAFDFSSGGSLRLYLYEDGSNQYAAQFQIKSVTDDSWSVMLPEMFSGEYQLELGFNNVETNLLDNWYYYSSDKVARNRKDATTVSFNDSDILTLDFYVETGYVITGSIVVPEEGYINKISSNNWEQSINLRFKNTDTGNSYSCNVEIQPANKQWNYKIVLPKQNGNYEFYAEGWASLADYYDTNIGITGKTDTLTLTVSGDTSAPDLRLPLLTRTISGKFIAEDGGPIDMDLSEGSVILTVYPGASGYDSAGEFPVAISNDNSWSATIPDNLIGDFRLETYFENVQSNLRSNTYYYADEKSATYIGDASVLTIGDSDITNLNIYVTAGYVVTGSIVIPEEGYINKITSNNWERSVNVYFKNLDTNNTYNTSVQIDPSSKRWDYRIVVSRDSGNYEYYAQGSSYLSEYYEYNFCLDGKTNVESVMLSGDADVTEIYFPMLNKTISGQFVVDGGGSIDMDVSGGSITMMIYEGSSGYDTVGEFPVTVAADNTWAVTVPDNLNGSYRLRMQFNNVQSNLLDTTYFYAENHAVTYMDDASVITIGESEITDLSFYVTAGFVVTGSIVIPDEGYITETTTNNWNNTISVRFRNVDTGNSYRTSVKIDPSSKRWDYRIVIPQQTGEFEYYAYGDSYVLQYYDTNVCLNGKTNIGTVTFTDNTPVDDLRFPLLTRVISGQFVTADGDPVEIDPSKGSVRLTVYQGNSGYDTVGEYPITITGGNTWSVTVPDNVIGEYRLYIYFDGVQSNLLPTSYYYAEGQATTSMSSASVLTIANEDITDLAFYVTTGYVVTGNVCVPEGGYINKINQNYGDRAVTVRFSNQNTYSNYTASAAIDPSSNSWAYRVVLPKQSGEYQYYASGSSNFMEYYDTNVWITGQTDTETITIDQSMPVNDLFFPLIRTTVSGTVSRPTDVTGYLYYNVFVKTENGSYSKDYSMYNDQSSLEYAIAVPDTDSAESYQLYYTASTNSLRNGPMYLKADGSLTETQSEAYQFAFSDNVHDFTLAPLYPCLEGHFYIPETVPDGENVYVRIDVEYYIENYGYYDSTSNSFNISVGSDLKTDIKGRYVEYSLTAPRLKANQPFYVRLYADNSYLNNKTFYVDEDNHLHVQREEASTFTYDGVTPLRMDLFAQTWNENSYIFESAHGLTSGSADYTYTFPGDCDSLTLHFAELSTDSIRINNSYYYPSGGDSYTVSGNTVTIRVNYNYDSRYGFAIDQITPNGVVEDKPGIAAVYTEQTGDSVIVQLINDNGLEATVYTGDLSEGTVLIGQAVLYDANGQFIGVASTQPFTVESEKNIPLHFNFDDVSNETASVAVLFLDENHAPLSEEFITTR